MRSAVRSCAALSAALVGTSVLTTGAATAPPALQKKMDYADVRLTANSIANIPANLINAIADLPANELAGIQSATKGLNDSGNWWLYTPTNVVGFDPYDAEKVNGFAAMLMPFPQVASALAAQLNTVLAAEAPMTADCTGIPGPCTNPTYFSAYFQVPISQLLKGYTFGTVVNTIDPSLPVPWSNTTVTLDPLGPAKAIWNMLTQTPATSTLPAPSAADVNTALGNLAQAAWNGLNPFVEGTYCLPCQALGAVGAPDSLPKFPLFGKYYTIFNLGQQFTSDDWVDRPPGVPPAANVTVTNLWTAQAWQQVYSDAVASVQDFFNKISPAAGTAGVTQSTTSPQASSDITASGLRMVGAVKALAAFSQLASPENASGQTAQANGAQSALDTVVNATRLAQGALEAKQSAPTADAQQVVSTQALSNAKASTVVDAPAQPAAPARQTDLTPGPAKVADAVKASGAAGIADSGKAIGDTGANRTTHKPAGEAPGTPTDASASAEINAPTEIKPSAEVKTTTETKTATDTKTPEAADGNKSSPNQSGAAADSRDGVKTRGPIGGPVKPPSLGGSAVRISPSSTGTESGGAHTAPDGGGVHAAPDAGAHSAPTASEGGKHSAPDGGSAGSGSQGGKHRASVGGKHRAAD